MSKEIQLTSGNKGHFLNTAQVFSPDGHWLVYDTRNDDSKIGSTPSIEMVNVQTREIFELYRTKNQTDFGPGVGAVSFSPNAERVIFIHGIRNADKNRPYGFTRRTGVAIDIKHPGVPIFMDARDITAPFKLGALRGGTHAHAWSGDGHWISFTYNDYVIEQLAKTNPGVLDLRTVGVMFPGAVKVDPHPSLENNSGGMFSVIVTEVTENPQSGTDEIDKAFDEGWVGTNGYRRSDGSWQQKAIAFQGNVRDENGNTKTELFVVDLPGDLKQGKAGKALQGTASSRPAVPAGVKQRRITFLKHGVLGPRHWLRSTPDGELITFLTKDDSGFVNVFGVSPNGGEARQLSFHRLDIQSGINISHDGKKMAYVAENAIYVTEIDGGRSHKLTDTFTDSDKPASCVNWSPDDKTLAYNRYVNGFLQIFLLESNYK
ncbi:DUF3748 domain-containing protein [Desertivirga xinjiangensis]|uniref:DUF3748 domain-containing protein n=1 Tax=Desertivirga xinjiangensis TaxID=539206 RepID=UPI00210E4411|nr:DUF3748 domain-containing protein [Pedobacter xinjiangensis]